MEAATASAAMGGTQSLIESLGFPVAMVVVLLGAMYLVAKAIKGWVDQKDAQAIAREQAAIEREKLNAKACEDRETRIVARLDEVQSEFNNFQQQIAKDAVSAITQNTAVLVQVNHTLEQVRKELPGSSDRRVAVR